MTLLLNSNHIMPEPELRYAKPASRPSGGQGDIGTTVLPSACVLYGKIA